MKPHRLTLTNALVLGYGLDKQIHNFFNPRLATQAELEAYHDSDYIEFLSRYTKATLKFPRFTQGHFLTGYLLLGRASSKH